VDWRVTDLPTDSEIQKEAPSYWRDNYCTIYISDVDQKAEEIRGLTEKYGLRVKALATYIKKLCLVCYQLRYKLWLNYGLNDNREIKI